MKSFRIRPTAPLTIVVTMVACVAFQIGQVAPASAAADWTQVQHNIRGHSGTAPDAPNHARFAMNWINAVDPIAASLNEVCQQQADAVWNALSATYHIWYVVSQPDACGGQAYGNLLLVAKSASFSASRSTTYSGYAQVTYSTPYTRIFVNAPSNYTPPEIRRVDCAIISGTSAGFSFQVCTTHLSNDPDAASAQFRAIRDNSQMNTPTMFMGDFNKTEGWMYQEAGSWQTDEPVSNPQPTTSNRGKLDWVLGRNTNYFAIRAMSDPKGRGIYNPYLSDHELLVAFMKAQYN